MSANTFNARTMYYALLQLCILVFHSLVIPAIWFCFRFFFYPVFFVLFSFVSLASGCPFAVFFARVISTHYCRRVSYAVSHSAEVLRCVASSFSFLRCYCLGVVPVCLYFKSPLRGRGMFAVASGRSLLRGFCLVSFSAIRLGRNPFRAASCGAYGLELVSFVYCLVYRSVLFSCIS